jgi:hypothetical protein
MRLSRNTRKTGRAPFALSTRTGILICAAAALLGAATLLSADTLTLRSGETVRGTYLGGTARQVRMDVNGDIRNYDLPDVQSVVFSDQGYQAPPQRSQSYPPPSDRYPPPSDRYPPVDRYPSNNQGPGSLGLTVPIDTQVKIRMIDAVNSDTARLGQTFRASLDEPIFVNGQEAIPRGADVLTKLVESQQSGKIEGRTELTLALSTIAVNGRPLDVTSSDVRTESSSRGARSAGVIGGATALGAIIGAVAGGGKGAAIGAGSGAVVGTCTEVLTSGQKVRIPSETRLTFRLQSPMQL